MNKNLLIVYHSKDGKTRRMAEAVNFGATDQDLVIECRFKMARESVSQDLLWSDGIIFGTPENFGYMSGGLKDFFDRTFYEVEGLVEGKPYCIFVGAGNDGTGAANSIRRICNGYNFREVLDPVLIVGELCNEGILQCQELGMAMAAGVEAGIF